MGKIENQASSWGTYKPQGVDRFILALKNWGLGRGALKKYLGSIWLSRHPNDPVDIEYHGIKLRMHPWESSIESKILFSSRLREKEEFIEMKKLASTEGIFLDIGANIGYYSLMAIAMGFGKALTIEPNPTAYSRLKFNVLANGFDSNVTTLQVGLSDHHGTATLNIPIGDIGSASVVNPAITGKTIEINLEPLKDILEKNAIDHIDAMKIDVEGMEDLALFPFYENAPVSLWPKLVIIEETSQNLWKRNIVAWMLSNGYKRIGTTRGNAILRM